MHFCLEKSEIFFLMKVWVESNGLEQDRWVPFQEQLLLDVGILMFMFVEASELTWNILKLALWHHSDVGLGLEKWQVIFLFTFSLIIMLRQIGQKFFDT